MMNDYEQVINNIPGINFELPKDATPESLEEQADKLKNEGIQHLIVGAVMLMTAGVLMAYALNVSNKNRR